MTLRNRFTLVGLGIVIFFIVTPALVLYARGFKIDWEHKTFVKTGTLVIKTQPTKAEIFLNEEELDSTSPVNVRFLLPNDYNIRIEKEGYQSWTKRLTIKSQLVTWVNQDRDFISLFLQNAHDVQAFDINASTVSKNNNEIIFLAPDRVGYINVNKGESQTLLEMADVKLPLLSAGAEIVWSNRDQAINFIADKNRLSLLESHLTNIQRLEIGNGHIAVLINSGLYSVESDKLALLDRDVSNFSLDGDEAWYVQKNLLKRFNFSNGKIDTIYELLPNSAKSKIIRTNNQIYVILDDTLYMLNEKLEKIYSPVTGGVYDDASGTLTYFNDNEIYSYQPNINDSALILRSLTAIKNPIRNDLTGYVFYQNEGKIKAIELDGRDHRNIFTITDALENFYVSEDGKKLFTVGKNKIQNYTIR